MSYGFEIINSFGNSVITDGFKALRYFKTVYGPFMDKEATKFQVIPGYNYVGVASGKGQRIMGQVYPYWNGSAYDENYRIIYIYLMNDYTGPVHIFTDAPLPVTSDYGLELYAENGSKIYHSDEQGLDVLSVITLPITSVGVTSTYTINNPNNYDIAVINPVGNLGRYHNGETEYYLTVRIDSNTQVSTVWWNTSCKGCAGTDDNRHATVFPIFKKPII